MDGWENVLGGLQLSLLPQPPIPFDIGQLAKGKVGGCALGCSEWALPRVPPANPGPGPIYLGGFFQADGPVTAAGRGCKSCMPTVPAPVAQRAPSQWPRHTAQD